MSKTWAWACAGILAFSSTALAGRPLITNDAEALEHGKFQLELGVAYLNDDSCHNFDIPVALTYGLVPNLEIGIGYGGQVAERDCGDGRTAFEAGFSDVDLGFKWKVLDQERWLLSQAIAGAIKIPTADDDEGWGTGEVDYDLTWIITRQINEELGVLFNLGYTHLGDTDVEEFSDVLHYGPAVTYQLTPTLQPVAEIVLETPLDGGKTAAGANAGIRWQVHETLMLDTAIGTKVAGDWPHWIATVGLTWVS
jgi:hypothetical protein